MLRPVYTGGVMRKEYKRSLIKFSNYSLCVTLPKAMLNKLHLDKGDEVMISMKRGKIILEPSTSSEASSNTGKNRTEADNWEPMPELPKNEE
jgi:antitoxin component of MazEF toxin-antitoxin module